MIRRLATVAGLLTLVAIMVAAALFAQHASATPATLPKVVGNFLVDQDHNLAFSQNKQNEPAITRDPLTGVLIAGANDEIGNNLCSGTTTPATIISKSNSSVITSTLWPAPAAPLSSGPTRAPPLLARQLMTTATRSMPAPRRRLHPTPTTSVVPTLATPTQKRPS